MERYGHSATLGRSRPKAWPRAKRAAGAAHALATTLAIALTAALAGCGAGAGTPQLPETAQFVDEAFAALFPETWARLGKLPEAAPRWLGPAPEGAADTPAAPIALQNLDLAVDRLLAGMPRVGAAGGEKPPAAAKAIIASPLAAERLFAAAGKAGAEPPLLVVPFASSFGLSGGAVREVRYDYGAAYAAMGRRAAAAVLRLPARDGVRPACGVVFQENFMRGGDALAAFSSAFSAACGQNPIVAALDARTSVDPTGAARAAIAELLGGAGAPETAAARPAPPRPALGVLILAIDNASIADEAAEKAKGVEVLADASSWGEHSPSARLYRAAIGGDEAGLAKAASGLARRLSSGREASSPALVQLRLKTVFPKIF